MFHAVLGFSVGALNGPLRVLRRAFAFGHEAVAIFIVLSGYCLMLPVVRTQAQTLTVALPRFIARRATRILPPYFVTVAFSLALIATVPALSKGGTGTIWDDSLPGLQLGPIVSHLLLLHNWVPAWAVQINGPLWSVATEWQIYFFFPLLLLPLWRRYGMPGALLAAALLGYAPLLFAKSAASIAIPWYLLLFTLGMAAAAINFSSESLPARLRESVPWRLVCAGLWAACATLSLGAGKLWFSAKPATDALLGCAAAVLLVYLTSVAASGSPERSRLLGLLSSRPLVGLGHFSYSLYLSHLPVMALCFFGLQALGLAPLALAAALLLVSTPLCVAFAYAFHVCFERPFMNRR
jgi:peptidoglycan/LPS O-acetylase OafA/YrhL